VVITVVVTETPPPQVDIEVLPIVALESLPSVADVVDKIKPWVASITVESRVRGFFADFTDEGAGSGFVVRPDGYIVTNNHVVQGAREIQVHLPSGETYNAIVVGRDEVTDLAILKISAADLPTAEFAADGLRVGDWVMTMGNALDLKGGPTVTLGIISGLGRTIQTEQYPGSFYDLIQTDAAINNGNSGGPLVNLVGEVVGINQATLKEAQGISFAISAATAKPIIQSLIEHGRVVRPKIGFDGIDVTPSRVARFGLTVDEGVIVTRMSGDGPAFTAGIRVGDIVLKIDGTSTPDMATFLGLLWSYKVGDEILIDYVRDGEILMASLKLAERTN
jgi:serine protease Do